MAPLTYHGGCDPSDMRLPHAVLEEGLAHASRVIGAAPGDRDHATRVIGLYGTLLRLTRLHDTAEDTLLWPRLRRRAPSAHRLLDRMEAQHGHIDGAALRAHTALASYRDKPGDRAGEGLALALQALHEVLVSHLADEERDLLPVAAERVAQYEWDWLAAYVLGHDLGSRPWLMVGLFWDQLASGQRVGLLGRLPDPVRRAWTDGGEQAYARFLAPLRPLLGPPRPLGTTLRAGPGR
jgi:hypothetical protein